MDRLLRLLKDYYSRECSMNRIYCSIVQRVSNRNGHDPIFDAFMIVINYLMFDTYKNVVVLEGMLSTFKDRSMYHTVSYIDRSIPININHVDGVDDILNLLSTILRIEKSLNQSIIDDYTEFYYEGDNDNNDGEHSTLNGSDEQFKSHIKSILHCITIDIEERLNMLSSLTRVAHASIFCTCGYELPRLVSIDVKERYTYSKSSKGSSSMILTIHCPRCGRVYHSIVDGNSSVCNGREDIDDLHCYS